MEHYYKIIMKNNIINHSTKFLVSVILNIFFTSSCGFYKPVDARKVPASAAERVKQNLEKGEGFRAKNYASIENLEGIENHLVDFNKNTLYIEFDLKKIDDKTILSKIPGKFKIVELVSIEEEKIEEEEVEELKN